MQKIKDLIEECKVSRNPTLKLNELEIEEIPIEIFELGHLQTLDLQTNRIKSIPKEIGNLINLQEIWLTSNLLEELPIELSQLPKLRRIHLTYNKLTQFPLEFLYNEKVSHICLRNNLIEELPEKIEETKIREIQLNHNQIKKIPITFDNVDFYLTLSLEGNPFIDPPSEIFNGGLTTLLKFLYERDRGRTFTIPFITELKTTFKQYLTYFSDFVKYSKGKLIGFEVRDVVNGIELEVKTENNSETEIEQVKSYLQEYVSFIKTQVDEIMPNFEVELDTRSKDIVLLELKSQVRHLQTQVEIQTVRNSALIEDRDRYYNLLSNLTQNPPHFTIQNSASNLLTQSFNFDYSSNIQELSGFLNELRQTIPIEETYVTKELETIDTELLELEECGTDKTKINKTTFKKLKRILDLVNDEDSTLNKTLKTSKKAIGALQKVGKTYNKFAEWLAMPQVPTIFLGE